MIGGISANIACAPFFESGNGNKDFYLFLRDSYLGPDAIIGIANALISIDSDTEKYLNQQGNDFIKDLFKSLLNTYIEEAMDNNFNDYPIIDFDLEKEEIYAKMIEEFKIIPLSGAMISSTNNTDELDVAINAQRTVSSISNDREMIRAGIQLAMLYNELSKIPDDKKSKISIEKKKDLIREIGENICYPHPIRHWEYFNMSGIADTGDIKLVVSAMLAVVLDSEDFEDCVKKSGSCFYHASFISFNAGLIAEKIFGIPEDIANDGYTLLSKSKSLYDVVAEYEHKNPPKIVKKRSFLKRNF